jgi:hypothetical protein
MLLRERGIPIKTTQKTKRFALRPGIHPPYPNESEDHDSLSTSDRQERLHQLNYRNPPLLNIITWAAKTGSGGGNGK